MAKSLVGTQTEKNLTISYLNESQSYARYTFYAAQAGKESYFPLQGVFNETAANELRHAKIFLNLLPDGQVLGCVKTDTGAIGKTVDNLKISINEEKNEGVDAYLAYAKVADEEGFPEIAAKFRDIASIEAHHMTRFQAWLKQVEDGTVWKREKPIKWLCLVCGYIYEGLTPPTKCPVCDHPYQHYIGMDMLDL